MGVCIVRWATLSLSGRCIIAPQRSASKECPPLADITNCYNQSQCAIGAVNRRTARRGGLWRLFQDHRLATVAEHPPLGVPGDRTVEHYGFELAAGDGQIVR